MQSGRVVKDGRRGEQRRQQVGKVVIEGGAQGEAPFEGLKGRPDGAADVQPASVWFGIEFERNGGQQAAHRKAHGIGVVRLAVLFDEVAAQRLGLRVGLLQRPSGLRVGALHHGEVTVEEGLLLTDEPLGDVEGRRVLRVAVIEDHQRVVPVLGDVDAVGCAVQQADLGDARGRVQHTRRLRLVGCGGGGEAASQPQQDDGSCYRTHGEVNHRVWVDSIPLGQAPRRFLPDLVRVGCKCG